MRLVEHGHALLIGQSAQRAPGKDRNRQPGMLFLKAALVTKVGAGGQGLVSERKVAGGDVNVQAADAGPQVK